MKHRHFFLLVFLFLSGALSAQPYHYQFSHDTLDPILGMDWTNYGTRAIDNKNYLDNNQLTLDWSDAFFFVHPIYGFLLQGITNSIFNYFKY